MSNRKCMELFSFKKNACSCCSIAVKFTGSQPNFRLVGTRSSRTPLSRQQWRPCCSCGWHGCSSPSPPFPSSGTAGDAACHQGPALCPSSATSTCSATSPIIPCSVRFPSLYFNYYSFFVATYFLPF